MPSIFSRHTFYDQEARHGAAERVYPARSGEHPPALTPDYKTSILRSPRLALVVAAEFPFGGEGRVRTPRSWDRWTTT